MRGMLHVLLSVILPIIYIFFSSNNFSVESMILCCTLSGMYHRVAPYLGKQYESTFRLMDYLGSDVSILSYASILIEGHNDTFWMNKMPLVLTTMLISEFILFYYHYYVSPLEEMTRMLTHMLCLVFVIYQVVRHGNYSAPSFLIMFALYMTAFYIFISIDEKHPEHHIWSQHETFHFVLLFAFIVHIYISMNYSTQIKSC
ncbi:hypothetical protein YASMINEVIRUS_99 [Yasminevirus sp. GU-2018]|uniref:Uncharacterized protein n=1 Tax=Yasminevirus sp. GU-2018 TaxID=2420051 RepID=A0A5K0U937_9VIRU|nr:hypothetical protein YASMINEVIRUS_99 [Yasminevirus sp. GU-2018]